MFGWTGWDVFDHRPPLHHNTALRGERVHYTLTGAEVMVGSLNFELLEPGEGPNLWSEHIAAHGEGIMSIAVMFQTRDEGDAVKRAFVEAGMPVTMLANIGDHIEYYYLDTEERFGCAIESGSGHAADFVAPEYVYPTDDAPPTEKPDGVEYRVVQLGLVVGDLDARLAAYATAFGWGPWTIHDSDVTALRDCELDGHRAEPFRLRWAEAPVGDIGFALSEPRGGDSPWQRKLDASGEGLYAIAVSPDVARPADELVTRFSRLGIARRARARVGESEWSVFDTEAGFKCAIISGMGGPSVGPEPITTRS
jgi:hypothetical protein